MLLSKETITVDREIYEQIKEADEKRAYRKGYAEAEEKALRGNMLSIFAILSKEKLDDESAALLKMIKRHPIFKEEMDRIQNLQKD